MRVLVWIAPATWPAAVDAVRGRPGSDTITLVAADDQGESLPTGVLDGLMGRAHHGRPAHDAALGTHEARSLLDQAATALGRPCTTNLLTGPTERVVAAAAADADLLVVARDGDRSRLGPHSLGRHARFIIDHAPCTVELIWPGSAPGWQTVPPPPGPPGGPR